MNTNFFNLSKRKKRDVLYELLTDNESEGIVNNKELIAINRLLGNNAQSAPLPKSKKGKTRKKPLRKKKKETKRKTTHYLTEEVFKNLDRAKKEIRSLVPENIRSRISKTQIVNRALSLILKEFGTKGEKSRLVRYLIQKN